uniref:Orf_22a n=1 Tax=Bombyx mori nuclear polyhedrosis virus TaxID=271108 RepID=U3RIP7_NPVBM|nr:Orf_22a [Bombyx mori nucleopolyhedrovirus]
MMQMAFMLFLNYTILILSKLSPCSQQRLEKRRRDLTKFDELKGSLSGTLLNQVY